MIRALILRREKLWQEEIFLSEDFGALFDGDLRRAALHASQSGLGSYWAGLRPSKSICLRPPEAKAR